MNKFRLEAFSDGVFAIVMTLLVIEIKVPHLVGQAITDDQLWHALWDLWPIFRSYFISFVILAMYWVAHHALFHMYTKHIDRIVTHINNLFLMFTVFVPFSAHLLGQYPHNYPSIVIYGLNIFLMGVTLLVMLAVVVRNPQLRHEELSRRLIIQGTIRVSLPPIFAVLAILFFSVNMGLSYFLLAFPIVFNLIPGTLDILERIFLRKKSK